jgi:hypothetical protein
VKSYFRYVVPLLICLAVVGGFLLLAPAGGERSDRRAGASLTVIERGFDNGYTEFKRAFAKDFEEGRRLMASLPIADREYRLKQLLMAEAISHEQAFVLADDEKDGYYKSLLLRWVFEFMGGRNDARGPELAERLEDPSLRAAAMSSFTAHYTPTSEKLLDLLRWAETRPEGLNSLGGGLRRMLGGLNEADTREVMKAGVAGKGMELCCVAHLAGIYLAAEPPKEAWERLLATGIGATEAAPVFFGMLGDEDPTVVMAAIDDGWVPDGARETLYSAIAQQLFTKDPDEALKWLDGLPESKVVGNRMYSEIEGWVRRDTMRASNSVATLKSPQARRLTTIAIVRVLREAGDKDGAAQWEQQLGEKLPDMPVISSGAAIPLQDGKLK